MGDWGNQCRGQMSPEGESGIYLTWLDITVGVRLDFAAALLLRSSVLTLQEAPLLLALFLLLRALPPCGIRDAGVFIGMANLHALHRRPVAVHSPECLADAQEEHHEAALGEVGVVDEVGVDNVLEVAAAVVGEEDVDGLGLLVGAALGGDAVVDGGYDGGHVGEEAVGVDLAHGLLDGLGAERAADLLEGEELVRVCVLDEVDVGEAALYTFARDG